ncbi:MAG TPA: hypothetical protein VIK28_07645 [Sedimentisphaerales bacterium]
MVDQLSKVKQASRLPDPIATLTLVHIDTGKRCLARVDVAIRLAQQQDAHLVALNLAWFCEFANVKSLKVEKFNTLSNQLRAYFFFETA